MKVSELEEVEGASFDVLGLNVLKPGEDRKRRREGDARREGVDEEAKHGLDTRERGRAAGSDGAEEDVRRRGGARERESEGGLSEGVEGEGMFLREGGEEGGSF